MFSLFAALVAVGSAQALAPTATWSIDDGNALVWAGKRYEPIGLRIEGTAASIEAAASAGVRDVMVELPAAGIDWTEVLALLESKKMRYVIAVSSGSPGAVGVSVEPEGYRLPNLIEATTVNLPIPGADRALTVLAMQRDGSVQYVSPVPVTNGYLTQTFDPGNGLPHVLLVYPHVREQRVPDYWEGFDVARDHLLTTLRKNPPGPGLRGLIDPMGTVLRFPERETHFVPTSRGFRMELEAYLRRKYTAVPTAIRSWVVAAPDFEDFATLARLVPLWSATRGVPMLWDPDTNRTYTSDNKRSAAWRDIQEVLVSASVRRYSSLVGSIQQVWNVPVLQHWRGWSGPYASSVPALDGLAMSVEGASPLEWTESMSRSASTVSGWQKGGWPIVSEATITKQEEIGALLDETASLGARGWYFRAEGELAAAVARSAAPRWFGKPTVVRYPESARNPASPMRLPGGAWWLPSPFAGERLDMGTLYEAYRMSEGPDRFVAIWSTGPARRTVLRLLDPKLATFQALDGTDVKAKIVKKGVELTISSTPVLMRGVDGAPVPEDALDLTLREFKAITEGPNRPVTAGEELMLFRDAVAGFDRNPGGAFSVMRTQVRNLMLDTGGLLWIEAEGSRDHTFSDLVSSFGASSSSALRLRARFPVLTTPPYARYSLTPVRPAEHQIWLAARISPADRELVRVQLGDQTLRLTGPAVSFYGQGFAWYSLGSANLGDGATEIRIEVDAKPGTDLALDALVASPGPFRPNGARLPAELLNAAGSAGSGSGR